jgi:hypothetical protein
MAQLGNGGYTYELIRDFFKLPDGQSFELVSRVAADSQDPRCGAMCRPNAAPSTSIAICSPAHPSGWTTRVSADYNDMIYAASPVEIEQRRFALLRKWRLRCKAVADSLEEAGDRLFAFTRLPLS